MPFLHRIFVKRAKLKKTFSYIGASKNQIFKQEEVSICSLFRIFRITVRAFRSTAAHMQKCKKYYCKCLKNKIYTKGEIQP